jgi:hypothetical protein
MNPICPEKLLFLRIKKMKEGMSEKSVLTGINSQETIRGKVILCL